MSKQSEEEDRDLHERRKRVIGRLFLRASRAFEARAVERIHALGYEDYRPSDNLVLIHLDHGATASRSWLIALVSRSKRSARSYTIWKTETSSRKNPIQTTDALKSSSSRTGDSR